MGQKVTGRPDPDEERTYGTVLVGLIALAALLGGLAWVTGSGALAWLALVTGWLAVGWMIMADPR